MFKGDWPDDQKQGIEDAFEFLEQRTSDLVGQIEDYLNSFAPCSISEETRENIEQIQDRMEGLEDAFSSDTTINLRHHNFWWWQDRIADTYKYPWYWLGADYRIRFNEDEDWSVANAHRVRIRVLHELMHIMEYEEGIGDQDGTHGPLDAHLLEMLSHQDFENWLWLPTFISEESKEGR